MPATPDTRRATIALVLMALLGVALVFLFPGSPEQDTAYHFLMARTAWGNPAYFAGVWARPLYTTLFAFADLLGFQAGRLLGVAIGVATAWQTWRLACDLKLERAWLVIPLLLAQPVFFELYPDMLTEPLFGLLFAIAIRWHLRGWVKRAMLLASFLPLARPEGFFLGILWGAWVLAETATAPCESSRPIFQKIARAIPSTLILATGTFVWWLAALCLSGDPLYIPHNWPGTWHQGMYGHGTIFGYAQRGWEFTGQLLAIPFLAGLWKTLRPSPLQPSSFRLHPSLLLPASLLLLFILHSIFRLYGLFGEAGYPRYMVSVSAAVAIITLQGWNTLARVIPAAAWTRARAALAWGVLAFSLVQSFLYLDSFYWARDATAINEMTSWLRDHPVPHTRSIWSNARMCIDLGGNLDASPALPIKGESTAAVFRSAPSGTLVFWDDRIGPDWFGMTAAEIEKCGYKIIRTRHDSLHGFTDRDANGHKVPPLEIEVTLLLKP